jgi:hypothetical protein
MGEEGGRITWGSHEHARVGLALLLLLARVDRADWRQAEQQRPSVAGSDSVHELVFVNQLVHYVGDRRVTPIPEGSFSLGFFGLWWFEVCRSKFGLVQLQCDHLHCFCTNLAFFDRFVSCCTIAKFPLSLSLFVFACCVDHSYSDTKRVRHVWRKRRCSVSACAGFDENVGRT